MKNTLFLALFLFVSCNGSGGGSGTSSENNDNNTDTVDTPVGKTLTRDILFIKTSGSETHLMKYNADSDTQATRINIDKPSNLYSRDYVGFSYFTANNANEAVIDPYLYIHKTGEVVNIKTAAGLVDTYEFEVLEGHSIVSRKVDDKNYGLLTFRCGNTTGTYTRTICYSLLGDDGEWNYSGMHLMSSTGTFVGQISYDNGDASASCYKRTIATSYREIVCLGLDKRGDLVTFIVNPPNTLPLNWDEVDQILTDNKGNNVIIGNYDGGNKNLFFFENLERTTETVITPVTSYHEVSFDGDNFYFRAGNTLNHVDKNSGIRTQITNGGGFITSTGSAILYSNETHLYYKEAMSATVSRIVKIEKQGLLITPLYTSSSVLTSYQVAEFDQDVLALLKVSGNDQETYRYDGVSFDAIEIGSGDGTFEDRFVGFLEDQIVVKGQLPGDSNENYLYLWNPNTDETNVILNSTNLTGTDANINHVTVTKQLR